MLCGCSTLLFAPVVQWIERELAELVMQVRFLPRALHKLKIYKVHEVESKK